MAGHYSLSGEPVCSVRPIGRVRKSEDRSTIVIDERYQPALLGMEALDAVWVLYWFDRNDNPAARSVLQVHPTGNPENPLRGVFATRSPFRPNLIALSRVKILAVCDNVMEIDGSRVQPTLCRGGCRAVAGRTADFRRYERLPRLSSSAGNGHINPRFSPNCPGQPIIAR